MPAATFLQDGQTIDYTPTVAVAAGAIVDLGHMVGVTPEPIAANTMGALQVAGAFSVTKSGSAGPVFEPGDQVYWDIANQLAVRTAAQGTVLFGTCIRSAGTSQNFVVALIQTPVVSSFFDGRRWEDVSLASSGKTLDIQDTGKVMNITAGHATNNVDLPVAAAGMIYVVRAAVAGQRIGVSPQAAEAFNGADLVGTNGKDRVLTAATARIGDFIAFEFGVAVEWFVRAERGIWAQEP